MMKSLCSTSVCHSQHLTHWPRLTQQAAQSKPAQQSTALRSASKDTISTTNNAAAAASPPPAPASAASLPRVELPQQPETSAQRSSAGASTTSSSSSSSTASTQQPSSSNGSSTTKRSKPVTPQWMAPTAAISVSGPYLTTSSIDGDSLIMSAEFLERELIGPYKFTQHQRDIIHELSEGMKGCSTAFVAVAVAGIALSVAASSGMPLDEAPEVLFNGITVGDVASWVDSLLVAYLLRFGASSFSRVETTTHEERQLAYTFQGINRLGLMFTQFSIAATTVSIVTTLEAASKWPPLVTLASGLFFLAALGRSSAMWYVLNKYGTTLDDVDAALEAQRRAYEAAHDEGLPLGDRLAIRLAFSYLLQYSAAGRRPSAAALTSAADTVHDAAAEGADGEGSSTSSSANRGLFAATTAAAAVAMRAGGRSASTAAAEVARKGMAVLQKIPLPILSRSTDGEETAAAAAGGADQQQSNEQQQQQQQQYVLTQAEERLVQACQSSLNTAGLALVMQTIATGLLVTANVAQEDYSAALADCIQVVNKAIAAELIFVATTNFDQALYTEGCDVEHLLEGLGDRGITKLFHNLSILAWAVVIAKGVELLAPWEEQSPLFKFIGENFSHQAADMVLEGQELLVNMMQ